MSPELPQRRFWRACLAFALSLAIVAAAPAADDDDDDDEDDDDEDETPALVTAAGGALPAAPTAPGATEKPGQDLRLNAGLGPYSFPRYPGARRSGVMPFPLVLAEYANRVEIDSLDGARVSALELGDFSLGPALRYRFGRQVNDNPSQLAGLRSFGPSVEFGGFAAYEKGPWYLDAVLTQDVTQRQKGAVFTLSGFYMLDYRGLSLEIGPVLQASTGAYMKSFYGVPDAPGVVLPAYRTHAGWERAGAEAALSVPLAGRWSVQLLGEYGYLLGSAAGSPIVSQGGSRNQWFGGGFLTYRFW